jgi:hypothetical protein
MKAKIVVIEVRGGLVVETHAPDEIDVVVVDWDVQDDEEKARVINLYNDLVDEGIIPGPKEEVV